MSGPIRDREADLLTTSMRIPTGYLLGGAGLYVGVTTTVYLRVKNSKCPGSYNDQQQLQHHCGQAFDSLADVYDQQIAWDEKLMGISLLRRWLVRNAQVGNSHRTYTASRCSNGQLESQFVWCAHYLQGDILEVSAGTGRNLAYYGSRATSVTMTDTSKNMLWHARQKCDKHHASLPVTFCLADAQRMLSENQQEPTMPDQASPVASQGQKTTSAFQEELQTFTPGQFDTIVDTFGLCSHEDPVTALQVALAASALYK